MTPKVQEIKVKTNTWDITKPKSFCTTKEAFKEQRDNL
jgi:hypothetical protein